MVVKSKVTIFCAVAIEVRATAVSYFLRMLQVEQITEA